MASSLFMLLDDIATVLDDVSIAAKKTAGVLGDDLALNAQQVTGVSADRELPVVWAVARAPCSTRRSWSRPRCSSASSPPWAIVPLLMLGGLFLCFEGVEKLAHKLLPRGRGGSARPRPCTPPRPTPRRPGRARARQDQGRDPHRLHPVGRDHRDLARRGGDPPARHPGRGAGWHRVVMTIGVYGLVAGIVKLDDLGLRHPCGAAAARGLGRVILAFAPWLMKGLSSPARSRCSWLAVASWSTARRPCTTSSSTHRRAGAVVQAIGPTSASSSSASLAGIAALVLFKLVTWPLRKRKA
jgi:predicted DNA repair protein MutK